MDRASYLVRAAGLFAIVVVPPTAWTVDRTIERARQSNQRVAHTQGVLAAAGTVPTMLADTKTGVRGHIPLTDPRDLEMRDRADRGIGNALDRLTALTAHPPRQQVRIQELRDPATRTLQPIHPEENRLLTTRVDADQAVSRVGWLSIGTAVAAVGVLGWFAWLLARDANRQRQGLDSLRNTKMNLEAQIGARTAELRDSNERLRTIIDSAVDGIIVIDAKGRIEVFNRGAERLFGYPESEVTGRNVNLLMPSPHHEEHDGYLARYLATGDAKIIGIGREVTGRRRDGTTFPLHLSVGEMSIGGERKFTGMLHELSESVRLEEQLRASEARWRAIIESAVDGIIVIDAQGRIEAFNPAAEGLFGYAEREVIGHNVKMLMPSPYREEHDSYLARYLATGLRKIIGTGREVMGLRRDGTTFPLHLSVGEMKVNGEQKFTGIVHDLGARVRIEEQLREQATLARLGEMAAVIAHEVKNPLAGIRGAIQVIGGRLPQGSKDSAMVKEILTRIDALNELMKDLLLFGRPPQLRAMPVDPRALVAATAELLSGDAAFNSVRVMVEGSAPPILADAELLKIVFVNLLVNGAHAMPGGGAIRVSLSMIGDTCHIAFSDTGPGIPAEIRDKLFTPFFTTKARGTGLGLSTAKRLVEAHGGTITITCPPDAGTTVTVQLPTQGVATD